ncbi:MAG: hypothetical protein NVSMB25_14200 [Thermoleophilaceae bacterium]
MAAIVGVLPAGAAARTRPTRAAPVAVGILTVDEDQALRSGTLQVRVRARRDLAVRVFVATSGSPVGRATIVATPTRTLRLRKGRGRTIGIPLLVAGRRALTGCANRMLELRVAVIGRRRGRVSRILRARRLVGAHAGRCRVAVGNSVAGGRGGSLSGSAAGGGGGGGGAGGGPAPIAFSTPPDADRCDFLDPAVCLQPFPNDYYTVPDSTTDTGRRVNLNILSMPRNRFGKPIDPAGWNRNDGFSPGSSIETKVPGLDTPEAFRRTGAVPIGDMAQSFDPQQPVVVINTRTLERQLIWAELDANPARPQDVNLIIRPGANFDEGTRYIVALRRMRDATGQVIPADGAFALYRDRVITTNSVVEGRRSHFEDIFSTLSAAGVDRGDLYRAWDFTVASKRNLTERVLSIRDDAFSQLGDDNLSDMTVAGSPPRFIVTKTTDFAPCPSPGSCSDTQNDDLIRRVEGRFTVPCYLDRPGCPTGSRFVDAPGTTNGPPLTLQGRVNTLTANFVCNIPRSAVSGLTVTPARPWLYGHGLLGTADQINGDDHTELARRKDVMFCATDWIGMANEDLPNVAVILNDLSQFPTLADRVQQGMVNFLYLGRLMIHPSGFSSDPAFQFLTSGGFRSAINTDRLFYNGDSQGGIIGGALTAIAPDFNRAVLGDVGMNYSTLLTRSSDFGTGQSPSDYSYLLYQSYPNEIEHPLIFGLMQMLWDRSEADGYAHHMTTDALANTPTHSVLLHQPFGDHQVANVASETEARTIGARMHRPALDPGRSTAVTPYYGIPTIDTDPFYDGPASFVTWDIGPVRGTAPNQVGTPPPPEQNVPPTDGEDPHGAPHGRGQLAAQDQISAFLQIDGRFQNVCGAKPCYSGSWTGPGP